MSGLEGKEHLLSYKQRSPRLVILTVAGFIISFITVVLSLSNHVHFLISLPGLQDRAARGRAGKCYYRKVVEDDNSQQPHNSLSDLVNLESHNSLAAAEG